MLNDEQRQIVEDNMNLVYSIAHKYNRPNLFDDLVQEGCIGLMYALERFDSNAGIKFSTYAYHYIVGYMNMFLRKNFIIKPHIVNKEYVVPTVCELTENICSEEDYDNIDTVCVNRIFEVITDTQKFIVVLLAQGYSQEEIARITGTTQGQISKQLQQVRNNVDVTNILIKFSNEGGIKNVKRRKRSKN